MDHADSGLEGSADPIYHSVRRPHLRQLKSEPFTQKFGHARFAKEPKLAYATNNARSEELEVKASYKHPWARGHRCIIPAADFDEPNWESGKNVWWRFRRPDGRPWGLAGLWNTWTDQATGEVHESYTMLTLNADAHPLMSRMHKPIMDKATKQPLPPELQDKRSVIPVDPEDYDQWLAGTVEEASALLRVAPVESFAASPIEGSVSFGDSASKPTRTDQPR